MQYVGGVKDSGRIKAEIGPDHEKLGRAGKIRGSYDDYLAAVCALSADRLPIYGLLFDIRLYGQKPAKPRYIHFDLDFCPDKRSCGAYMPRIRNKEVCFHHGYRHLVDTVHLLRTITFHFLPEKRREFVRGEFIKYYRVLPPHHVSYLSLYSIKMVDTAYYHSLLHGNSIYLLFQEFWPRYHKDGRCNWLGHFFFTSNLPHIIDHGDLFHHELIN